MFLDVVSDLLIHQETWTCTKPGDMEFHVLKGLGRVDSTCESVSWQQDRPASCWGCCSHSQKGEGAVSRGKKSAALCRQELHTALQVVPSCYVFLMHTPSAHTSSVYLKEQILSLWISLGGFVKKVLPF